MTDRLVAPHDRQPVLVASARWQRWLPAGLVLISIALGLWLRLQGVTAGGDTGDVAAYRGHVEVAIHGGNVYASSEIPEYPYLPGWLAIEVATFRASEALDIPFWQLIRLVIITADVLVCFALWWAAAQGGQAVRGRWAAALYALSPIAILTAGYHGQFDTLPMLLAVLAFGCLLIRLRPVVAGLLLGAAIAIKPFPVLLIPILLRMPGLTRRARLSLVLAIAGVIVLVAAPFLIADAVALIGDIVGYTGVDDQGIAGLLRSLWLERAGNLDLPGDFGANLKSTTRYLTLAAMVFVYLVLDDRPAPSVAAAVLLAFVGLYGGISTQYLVWPLAWLLLSDVALIWPVVYGFGTAAGAIGFYLVFWPQLVLGPDVQEIQTALAPFYIIGQLISWVTIMATLGAVLARSLTNGWWRRLLVTVVLGLAIGAFAMTLAQIGWLAGQWLTFGD